MSKLFGIHAEQNSTNEDKPHTLAYNTARTTANKLLFDLLNGSTVAARKACVDLNGKYYSAAATAGDLLYAVAGGVANVQRLDSLAIGTAGQALKVNAGATAPEWGAVGVAGGGTGLTTFTAAGRLLYSTGATTLATLAIGTANQVLQTNSGATAPEWTSTLTGVTLAGTVSGTPTWASNQAITLSTAAQPNITSLGTLTSLAVSGLISANGGLTVANGQTLTLTGATVAGTPTWSSAQAITLSTAAQPNVTSLGTLSALTVSGFITASVGVKIPTGNPILLDNGVSQAGIMHDLYTADRVTIISGTAGTEINASDTSTVQFSVDAAGLATAHLGLTVSSGQTLTLTGATITGLTAASVGAGTFPGALVAGSSLTVNDNLVASDEFHLSQRDKTNTGTVNQWNLDGATYVSWNGADHLTINGIKAPGDGEARFLVISNLASSGQTITFNNENAGAAAADRLRVGGSTKVLNGIAGAIFVYDTTQSRWRVVANES